LTLNFAPPNHPDPRRKHEFPFGIGTLLDFGRSIVPCDVL
jgi:hypothetical protein